MTIPKLILLFGLLGCSIANAQTTTYKQGIISSNDYNHEIPVKFLQYNADGNSVNFSEIVDERDSRPEAFPITIIMKADERLKRFELEFVNHDPKREYIIVYYTNFSKEGPFKRSYATKVKYAKNDNTPRTKIVKFPMNIAFGDTSNELADGIDPHIWHREGRFFQIRIEYINVYEN